MYKKERRESKRRAFDDHYTRMDLIRDVTGLREQYVSAVNQQLSGNGIGP